MRNRASVRTPAESRSKAHEQTHVDWLTKPVSTHTYRTSTALGRLIDSSGTKMNEAQPLFQMSSRRGPFSRESHALYSARVAHGGKHHRYAG